ncbi:aspartyl protease family protein At5g10770-like [Telopea speciosissima]|uniref:aspartyl protease family protein At5g10770-like n=1 Tax=Telopea speciosissima TaxID=54955 RepID=UPI001CC3C310|nr:aspartyl protease family protein At5g10770-like [Telopea speciosissima]
MPAGVCSTPAQGSEILSRQVLQVTHKHGPCSPLKEGNAKIPSLGQILKDDRTRIKSIHSKISNQQHYPVAESGAKIPVDSGQSLGSGNFVVRIGLRTPMQNFTVIFDTGSDFTWIQCQPCAGQCYLQQDPIFNLSASSTYSNVSCNSIACAQLQSATGFAVSCTTNPNCIYQVTYGDGSYSQGYFATDTLTILPSSDVFPKFKFGCGQNNDGPLFGFVDGLLALGHDQTSMVSQTVQIFGKLFSYCLPPTSSSTGFLAFGSQVGNSSTAQYTPLLTDPKYPSLYFLNMTGISVGGKSLPILQSVFTTSGTIIDSGTVITRLPPTAYSALRSSFRQAMFKYPITSPYLLLDTCYTLAGNDTAKLPTIVLHFTGGTDFSIDKSGILVQASLTQYCLAFAGNNNATDLAILGSMQQHGIEMIYNVAGGKLGFGTSACSVKAISTIGELRHCGDHHSISGDHHHPPAENETKKIELVRFTRLHRRAYGSCSSHRFLAGESHRFGYGSCSRQEGVWELHQPSVHSASQEGVWELQQPSVLSFSVSASTTSSPDS